MGKPLSYPKADTGQPPCPRLKFKSILAQRPAVKNVNIVIIYFKYSEKSSL